MNILIIGAGAIGGFIGGKLAAQHNVTLFDRAPLVDAVRARGLRIIEPESETTVTNLNAFTSLKDSLHAHAAFRSGDRVRQSLRHRGGDSVPAPLRRSHRSHS